jgi:DNA repair protein RecO (recombination protein O)
MLIEAPAIVCALRLHGETGAVVRVLTKEFGLVAGYVAGARGRQLRPVLIPGNLVQAELKARQGSQLPSLRVELVQSRGPWLAEPLPAMAISWATALTAATLPERHAYPALHQALAGLLDAICAAPSARGWVPALIAYETLLLRELGYGGPATPPLADDWQAQMTMLQRLGTALARYPLAERRADVMAARELLTERLNRIGE